MPASRKHTSQSGIVWVLETDFCGSILDMRLTVKAPTNRVAGRTTVLRIDGAISGRIDTVDPNTGFTLGEIRSQCIATNEADRIDGSQEFLDALTADLWAEE